MDFLQLIGTKIATGVVGLSMTISGLFGVPVHYEDNTEQIRILEIQLEEARIILEQQTQVMQSLQDNLGASLDIPTPIAFFETSLSGSITSSDTSMTLVSATDKDGNTLASSTYPFVLDEGTANEELVIADCTGTACTNMQRGLSVLTGTSTVSSLQKAHRRGASVKITNAPSLLILNRIVNGQGDFPNLIRYKAGTSVSASDSGQTIITKEYADNLTNQGAATSSTATAGINRLATALQQASSTDPGVNDPLVLQAKNATSTPQSGCDGTATAGALCNVIAQNDGKVHQGYLNLNETFIFASSTITEFLSTNATTTNATTTNFTISSLATPAGTLLAADPNGGVVATSTPISSYASAPVATSTASSNADFFTDHAYTIGFQPTIIHIFYGIQGKTGSGTACYTNGNGAFTGTTLTANYQLVDCEEDTSYETTDLVIDTGALTAGGNSSNSTYLIEVQSVSATGYTIRVTHDGGSTFTGASATFYSIAHR